MIHFAALSFVTNASLKIVCFGAHVNLYTVILLARLLFLNREQNAFEFEECNTATNARGVSTPLCDTLIGYK